MERDPLTRTVIGCAIEVHRTLGPGLLESTYEKCLAWEFNAANIPFTRQAAIPIRYKKVLLDCGYKIDILVENSLILELKVLDGIKRIHEAQILKYMKLANINTGLLINFNETRLIDGIRRFKQ